METGNRNGSDIKRQVVSGLEVIETQYRVERPVYEDVKVERPVYVDKPFEVPTGLEQVVDTLVLKAVQKIESLLLSQLDEKLSKAIDDRLKEIVVPKIIYKEEVNVITKDVEVINAVITDKPVTNAVITDKEVINAVLKDTPVINPIIVDQNVTNAIIENVQVKNAVITEVPVTDARIKVVTVEAVKPKWLKPDGTNDL